MTIWTIGHSTRPIAEFLDVLAAYRIEALVDVRRFPGSRRLPQFQQEALESAVVASGMSYLWLESLGGRRKASPESASTGWTHPAFRAYADYARTEEFAGGLFDLLMTAGGLRSAVMCAEVLWWRCHRRIIADVLVSLGLEVVHVRSASVSEKHRLAAPAIIRRGTLIYP